MLLQRPLGRPLLPGQELNGLLEQVKSVGKVIHAFCHYPNLVATEQARVVRIGKTTFYDNWERLKTFLTCAELFEMGLDSMLAEATAEAEAEA